MMGIMEKYSPRDLWWSVQSQDWRTREMAQAVMRANWPNAEAFMQAMHDSENPTERTSND